MKKILYISHISWGWIKQRPQFLAEELAKECKVDVYYRGSNRRGKNLNPRFEKGNLSVKGFKNFPFERFTFISPRLSHQINKLIWKLKRVKVSQYDYVWVTDPVLWWMMKDSINGENTKLIYDCMDDNIAFSYMDRYPKYKDFYMKMESELIKTADFVFCSATSLVNKLHDRYGISRNFIVENNAITDSIESYSDTIDGIELPSHSLTYIGTISEWFDFENTLRALEDFPTLNVVLYGPKRMPEIPRHPRLHIMGSTEHRNILAIMKQSSALFMPFIVNDLIESVNPVKLYEYIYAGKPILASRYSETIHFKDYVTLYSDYSEFKSFVSKYVYTDTKIDAERMKKFALSNTWGSRTFQILNTIGVC